MGASNWVHLSVAIIHCITKKAMLLELEDGEEFWIPLSQICNAYNYSTGDVDVTVSVSSWIAEQKGIGDE